MAEDLIGLGAKVGRGVGRGVKRMFGGGGKKKAYGASAATGKFELPPIGPSEEMMIEDEPFGLGAEVPPALPPMLQPPPVMMDAPIAPGPMSDEVYVPQMAQVPTSGMGGWMGRGGGMGGGMRVMSMGDIGSPAVTGDVPMPMPMPVAGGGGGALPSYGSNPAYAGAVQDWQNPLIEQDAPVAGLAGGLGGLATLLQRGLGRYAAKGMGGMGGSGGGGMQVIPGPKRLPGGGGGGMQIGATSRPQVSGRGVGAPVIENSKQIEGKMSTGLGKVRESSGVGAVAKGADPSVVGKSRGISDKTDKAKGKVDVGSLGPAARKGLKSKKKE